MANKRRAVVHDNLWQRYTRKWDSYRIVPVICGVSQVSRRTLTHGHEDFKTSHLSCSDPCLVVSCLTAEIHRCLNVQFSHRTHLFLDELRVVDIIFLSLAQECRRRWKRSRERSQQVRIMEIRRTRASWGASLFFQDYCSVVYNAWFMDTDVRTLPAKKRTEINQGGKSNTGHGVA